MQTADFSPEDFEVQNQNKGVYGKFYYRERPDEEKTLLLGTPQTKMVEFVEILSGGSTSNIPNRPVTEHDKRRFPRSYAMFKAGDAEQIDGTALTELTIISKGQREELFAVNVRTLEALAGLHDGVCAQKIGFYDLKRHAQTYLEKAKGQAPLARLTKENIDLQKRVEALESLLVKANEDDAIEAVQKKRGRKPKTE